MKTNLAILFMPHEVEVTLNTVRTLRYCDLADTSVSLLLNGGTLASESPFLQFEFVSYYESSTNLGVAGGRNFLMETPENRKSEFTIFLDNDVVPTTDFVTKMVKLMEDDPGVGVAGGVVARFTENLNLEFLRRFYKSNWDNQGGLFILNSEQLRSAVLQDFNAGKLFHMGTHANFKYTYFSILRHLTHMPGLNAFFPPSELKFDADVISTFMKDSEAKVEVANVAGCNQIFRTRVARELGKLCDSFNPYGYEDVEFSFRMQSAGYRNVTTNSAWIMHGTDTRHRIRLGDVKFATNRYRAYSVLAFRVYGSVIKAFFPIAQAFAFEIIGTIVRLRGSGRSTLKNMIRGFLRGRRDYRSFQSEIKQA